MSSANRAVESKSSFPVAKFKLLVTKSNFGVTEEQLSSIFYRCHWYIVLVTGSIPSLTVSIFFYFYWKEIATFPLWKLYWRNGRITLSGRDFKLADLKRKLLFTFWCLVCLCLETDIRGVHLSPFSAKFCESTLEKCERLICVSPVKYQIWKQ